MQPSYVTFKNWVAHFKRGDFSTCAAPRSGRPKTVTTPEITMDNKFQNIFCICDEYVTNLFVCIYEVIKWT